MMRALYHLAPIALLVGTACGRGPLEPLKLQSTLTDGAVTIRDGGPNDPIDAGFDDAGNPIPIRDGGPTTPPPPPPPPPPRDGGVGDNRCESDRECFERFGEPICRDGDFGDWDCDRGRCTLICPPPPTCLNDCDCPFQMACGNGQCLPLSRNNRCCAAPFCPPGETCELPGGGTSICPDTPPPPRDGGVVNPPPPDGGVGDGGVPDGGVTPVGAPCMSDTQCLPAGFCIDQSSGFPDGYCSQECGRGGMMCPPGADCRDFGQGQRLCLDECMLSAECRANYVCVQLGIDPQKVCWPVSPGSTNPNGDPVGSACMTDQNCVSGLTCLQIQGWRGGYCTVPYCDPQNNPCPTNSSCYAWPGLFSLCLAECPSGGSQSSCRNGYYCFGPSGQTGGCIPN